MKKIVLLAVLVSCFCSAIEAKNYKFGAYYEQKKNLVKISVGFFYKVRLSYERGLTNTFSAGGTVNACYGVFPGVKLEGFGRLYFGGEAPKGLYLQLRGLYGVFSPKKLDNFSSTGVGGDIGYQWLSGKNHNIVVDVSLGSQLMIMNHIGKQTYDDNFFYLIGPGAIINPRINLGIGF